jgi:hypothetical protein
MTLIRQKAMQDGRVRISPGAVSLTQYRSSYLNYTLTITAGK